jgi:hypothetical protein
MEPSSRPFLVSIAEMWSKSDGSKLLWQGKNLKMRLNPLFLVYADLPKEDRRRLNSEQ